MSKAPDAALASAPGLGRGMAVLNHHRSDAEGGRGAQNSPDIMGIESWSRTSTTRAAPGFPVRQYLVRSRDLSGRGFQGGALMDGPGGQQPVNARGFHDFDLYPVQQLSPDGLSSARGVRTARPSLRWGWPKRPGRYAGHTAIHCRFRGWRCAGRAGPPFPRVFPAGLG